MQEVEQFTFLAVMARANLIPCVYFQTILKTNCLTEEGRNLEIVQLDVFQFEQGSVLKKEEKLP